MEELNENQRKERKKYLFIIVGLAILLIGIVGVTYAFFNYTRTGAANNIRTGRIYFNTEEGDSVSLSNLFPIEATAANLSDPAKVGSVAVHVEGDTEYAGGVEYLIKAVDVTNTTGSTALPISISVEYNATTGESIGTPVADYFSSRGGTTSVYKLLATNSITDNANLLVGYIAPGATGIDGDFVIKAYLDAANIAISDTYPEGVHFGLNSDMTSGETTSCETLIATGYTSPETAADFCAGTGTRGGKTFQEHLDEELFGSELLEDLVEANVILEEYTDGTTTSWVHGRTVLTTEEWNALSTSGISFKVQAEANEGIWVSNIEYTFLSDPPLFTIYDDIYKYEINVSLATDTDSATPITIVVTGLPKQYKFNTSTHTYVDITSNEETHTVNTEIKSSCSSTPVNISFNNLSGLESSFQSLDADYIRCLAINS